MEVNSPEASGVQRKPGNLGRTRVGRMPGRAIDAGEAALSTTPRIDPRFDHRMTAKRFCLFGAAPDTGNLGVSALCFGTLGALFGRLPGAEVTVFDYARGMRRGTARLGGREIGFVRLGASHSRRFYRADCLRTMQTLARFGAAGASANPGVRAMADADAVMDISGGDSFTDLYGPHRFGLVSIPKLIALRLGTPLILLPQTYGPFKNPDVRATASRIVRESGQAWARDERSFAALRDLAGNGFDERRHRSGVDVAFGLETREPREPIPEPLAGWLARKDAPLVGFNVSGLILNSADGGRAQYGLQADYAGVVTGFLRRMLERTDARVALVSHVLAAPGNAESDQDACAKALASLGRAASGRVVVAPAINDASEVKWLIARCDWFCGTRMHATIAGLSSCVPTAAIAYSLKTQGVFETCGQGEHVADPRHAGTEEMIESLWRSWERRAEAKASLTARVPAVAARADEQMREILESIHAGSEGRGSVA